jgi:hypothetical protein
MVEELNTLKLGFYDVMDVSSIPTKYYNVDYKYYEKHELGILSFVWWTDIIEDKYIHKFKRRNSNSSKKEYAMDKSWNKGISRL